MRDRSRWFASAAVVALIAGFFRGFRLFLPPLLVEHDVPSPVSGVVLSIVTLITVLASPVGVFLSGYRWGSCGSARSGYKRLSVTVYGVAVIGFIVGYLASRGPLLSGFRGVAFFGTHVLGLVSVALASLAGVTVGYFRSTEDPAQEPESF